MAACFNNNSFYRIKYLQTKRKLRKAKEKTEKKTEKKAEQQKTEKFINLSTWNKKRKCVLFRFYLIFIVLYYYHTMITRFDDCIALISPLRLSLSFRENSKHVFIFNNTERKIVFFTFHAYEQNDYLL